MALNDMFMVVMLSFQCLSLTYSRLVISYYFGGNINLKFVVMNRSSYYPNVLSENDKF